MARGRAGAASIGRFCAGHAWQTAAGGAALAAVCAGPLAVAGRQVMVVSRRDGSKLYVANTGTGYPLRADLKGPDAGRLDFTEYGARFQVTAPGNAINISGSG